MNTRLGFVVGALALATAAMAANKPAAQARIDMEARHSQETTVTVTETQSKAALEQPLDVSYQPVQAKSEEPRVSPFLPSRGTTKGPAEYLIRRNKERMQ